MNEKGWANAAPAGLVALAVAAFIFFAMLTGRVETSCMPLMGCWLIGGFVVQLIVGLIELKEGATTGGNVFLFFCAFFMLTSGIEMFVKYWAAISGNAIDTHIDGWAWLVLASSLILWTAAYLKKSNKVMGLTVLCLDPGLLLVALTDMGVLSHTIFGPIAGCCLLAGGIFAVYHASAIILNNAYKRTVFPVGSSIVKSKEQ